MKTRLLLLLSAVLVGTAALAQKTIYAYAIGDWRNGPVVHISPMIETTEMFSPQALIRWVRQEWPTTFTDTTDIDVQFFAVIEDGEESRATLKAKYGVRKLPVNLMEAAEPPRTPERPE